MPRHRGNFNDYLTLILEAQNLTEERNTLFIDSVREDTLFQTDIGRTYTLGATIKFRATVRLDCQPLPHTALAKASAAATSDTSRKL